MKATYPKSTVAVAKFIKKNWGGCSTWNMESLLRWLQWHVDKGRFIGVKMGGAIVGVVLFRMIDSEKDVETSDYTDTGGKLCYIALCVSEAKEVIRAMYGLLWDEALNKCDRVCWARTGKDLRKSYVSVSQLGRRLGYG